MTPVIFYPPNIHPQIARYPAFSPLVAPLAVYSQQTSTGCSPPYIVQLVETGRFAPYPMIIPSAGNLDAGVTPIWPPEQLPPLLPRKPAPCYLPCPPPEVFEAGTFPAQPLGSKVPVRLHPHIIVNPNDPGVPVLLWDVIHAAELARVVSGRNMLLPLNLGAPAVTPAVKKIYITSDAPYLKFWMSRWGPIIINSASKNIKVRDVLDAIHAYFQTPLTESDMEMVGRLPMNLERIKHACACRIHDSYDSLPPLTAKMGYKRSDILGGMRKFQGLRVVVFANRTWKVYLGLTLGTVTSPTP